MKNFLINIILFFSLNSFSQTINLNQSFIENDLRIKQLNNEIDLNYSFTIRPINFDNNLKENFLSNYSKTIFKKNNNFFLDLLPVEYIFDYNSHHPYNRNNGSMLPNKGYQHIVSTGFFLKAGPLTIQFKPEHHYAENKDFPGFWEGHEAVTWSQRYGLWNTIDMPERFGFKRHNRNLIGQSSIRLNWKNISLGFSNENIWWGPSIRNSIMMSNHAQGFRHITLNSTKPIEFKFGILEWQFITGRLDSSGYTPPNTDFEYAGTKLYVPKYNQGGITDDWRFLQGYVITFSPKIVKGLSLGFIRWVQMYSDLIKGEFWWLDGNPSYFPVFSNLFRKNDKYENYEALTNQAAGIFFRWVWEDSKAEIYAEFHHNDSKQNLRDLLLDSDHSRAFTAGLQKVFLINNKNFLFSWEWTQMEQTASRLVRNAGSWYQHNTLRDGYTNRGEVLGSSIGPGSNSHYFNINLFEKNYKAGIGFEIVDQDNDFYHEAFSSSLDFRRYWKDFNFHFNFERKFKYFWMSSNLVYQRSLNYQWELIENASSYYQPGNDLDNFHLNVKLTYFPSF